MMKAVGKNNFSKTGVSTTSHLSPTAESLAQNEFDKTQTTVDASDVIHHSKFSNEWWDLNGRLAGLHHMNPLRVKLVRDGLVNTGFEEKNENQPLQGINLLDVGCGGGILSEALARIGANVTGLDASEKLISIAKQHAALDEDISSRLNYVNTTIEDLCQSKKNAYDVVVASEILEHVDNQALFLKSCCEVLKPKGSIFVTTFNKNLISWLVGIIAAEYIVGVIPKGTHDWNKFITPEDTARLLKQCNCEAKLIHGTFYNPITKIWGRTSSTLVHYALHAVKNDV